MSAVSDTFINNILERAGNQGLYRTSAFVTHLKQADALEVGQKYVELTPQYSLSSQRRGSAMQYQGHYVGNLQDKVVNKSQKTVVATFENNEVKTLDARSLFLSYTDFEIIANALPPSSEIPEKNTLRPVPISKKPPIESPPSPIESPLVPLRKPTSVRPLPALFQRKPKSMSQKPTPQRRVSQRRMPTSERRMPTSERRMPTSERRMPTSERRMPKAVVPKCPPGKRRCPIVNECVSKDSRPLIKARCKKGYRKCADNLCHHVNGETFEPVARMQEMPRMQEIQTEGNTNRNEVRNMNE